MDDSPTQNEETPVLSEPAHKNSVRRARVFLAAYAKTGDVQAAAKAAGVTRDWHYKRLKSDPVYAHAFEERQRSVGEDIEAAIVDRVLHGVKRLVLYQGEPVIVDEKPVYEVTYDSHLSHVLLKRFLPAEYRERISAEISGEIQLVERMTTAVERVRLMRRSNDTADRAG
jgi:hypothetical protein